MLPACPPLPAVIGHRGAAAHAPENTLAGFRRAHALGCRWVEFDVRLSGDGVPMLCHDSRIDRTTDGSGRVAALKLAALRRLDAGGWFRPEYAGERMPTLDEALAFAAALGLGANIEIKADRGRARATARVVAEVVDHRTPAKISLPPDLVRGSTNAPRQLVAGRVKPGQGAEAGELDRVPILASSFHLDALAEFRALSPEIPTGLLLKSVPRSWRELAARLGSTTINVDHTRLNSRLVEAMRAEGYPVLAYTVNDPARAALLFDWGITSVFSDVPDIILGMIASDRRLLSYQQAGTPAMPPRQGVVA